MQRIVGNPVKWEELNYAERGVSSGTPWFEGVIRQNRFYFLGLLAFLSLCTLVAYYLPPLLRADVYTNDMCEHVAWYQAAKNPALFQYDIMKTYFIAMSPLGYKAVFSTVCAYVDPQTLGEILSLVLGMAGVLLAYKLGEAVTSGSAVGGIVAVLLLLFGHVLGLHQFIKVFQGGLQRAFALPIFLLGTWAVLRARVWGLCAALILAALFFPPVCVVLVVFSASVMGLALLKDGHLASPAGRDALIVAGTSVFCAALLLLANAVAASHGHWTIYTLKEAVKMPECYAGGIWDARSGKPILYPRWSDYITKAITVPHPVLLMGTTLVFFWRARKHRTEAVLLIISALATWSVAYLALFHLFEPGRYIDYALMILWLLVLPGVAIEVIRFIEPKLKPTLTRLAPAVSRSKTGYAIGFVVIVAIATTYLTVSRFRNGEGGMIGTAPPAVYAFLHSLPKNVKIAAHPIDANDIPMRSQRSVLAFDKAMFPYHREFYEEMKSRIAATWTAMYATNSGDILQLKHRYGADILLINEAWYRQDPITVKPFDAILESCRRKLQGGTPLVLRLPQEVVVFRSGPFSIIDLAALDRLQMAGLQAEQHRGSRSEPCP
jgi:hypothetical protein